MGDSVVVVKVLDVTVTVLVRLTGIGSRGVCDSERAGEAIIIRVGDAEAVSSVIVALLKATEGVSIVID